eukprot:GHUV01050816.1.p1 GENE.GHUV01050816.1~~GHUV01050816.1.p1  ORF type:complete len:135 (-),score=26.08 GHUV01050816.1:62-466(-)
MQDSHACSRCHSAATCAAVHAVVEGGTASSSGMDESQWTSLAGAVSAAAAEWGRKWLNCIDWEEAAGRARRAEMWALTGRCVVIAAVIYGFVSELHVSCGLAGAVSAAAAEWGRKWLNCIEWEEAAGRARRAEM